jgi:iron transport multicopper oxidase
LALPLSVSIASQKPLLPGLSNQISSIEWHMDQGLIATFVEAPLEMQKSLVIPDDHKALCAGSGVPMVGNAAGNTKDVFDLSGQNHPPAPLPAGFTPRGIVAMTFSVLAALLGLAAIAWYGLADMGAASKVEEERRIARMAAETNEGSRSDVSEAKAG